MTVAQAVAGAVMVESSTTWTEVCELDDIRPASGVAAKLGEHQIAVVRTPIGTVHALANVDPFSGAAVLSRGIVGERDGCWYVASPLHKQRFDLGTGRCLDDPDVAVETYPVRVFAGRVSIASR